METEQMVEVAGAGGRAAPRAGRGAAVEQVRTGLPAGGYGDDWSDDEKAAVEAAGLVFVHSYGDKAGLKVLAPRPIVAQFLHLAAKSGLDPLARQLYCIGRFGQNGLEWSIQTGIDGFRLIAERSQKYAGQDGAEWFAADHGWVDVFIPAIHGEHPLAARVRVYRHDWDRPAIGIAVWDEYAQTKRNGQLTAMWEQRGPGQLAKCAEALALRKAFPQDLSGLYTAEEMGNAVSALEQVEPDVPEGARSRVQQRSKASEAPEGTPGADVPESGSAGRVAPEEAGSAAATTVELFACARCGDHAADEAGQLCDRCEVEVEAEIAAEEGAGS